MKKINTLLLFCTLSLSALVGCGDLGTNNTTEKAPSSEVQDSSSSTKAAASDVQEQLLTEDLVLARFKAYLTEIKEEHSICTDCDHKGLKVITGDLNGDHLPDAIVQYQFNANEEYRLFGQSGIYDLVGFAVLLYQDGQLSVTQTVPIADVLSFSVTESVSLTKINSDGTVTLSKEIDRRWDEGFDEAKDERFVTKDYKTKVVQGKLLPLDL